MYKHYQQLILDCDKELDKILSLFEDKIASEDIEELKEQKVYKSNRAKKNAVQFPVAPPVGKKISSRKL